jgi:hypothetical protein
VSQAPDKPFTEALGDLLADYSGLDIEQMIADMEMHIDALYDDLAVKSEQLENKGK